MINPEAPSSVSLTCVGGERHGFQRGEYVRISGIPSLERSDPWPVEDLGPFAFAVGSASDPARLLPLSAATGADAKAVQVKVPSTLHHLPLEHAETEPQFVDTDWSRPGRAANLHMIYRAVEMLEEKKARPFDPEADK